ncbi:MAG: esterase-like activity of phytase family protein, partial [Rhodospirillaceae bacterium]
MPEPLPPPDGLAALPANSGIEALALLSDGRLLAITEGRKDVASALAWVSDTDGWSPLTYPTDGEFRPTGAATLP